MPAMVELGPSQASLKVHTAREGVAAKIGHDLEIEVADWSATYGEDGFELTADAGSLRIVDGHGGAKPLSDGDRKKIDKNIDNDTLGGGTIHFKTTAPGQGDLTLNNVTKPVPFVLDVAGGKLAGEATVKQTDFGVKPYTGFLGALKVADEVRITVDGNLP